MTEAQLLREKVAMYFNYEEGNDAYLNFWYIDELGQQYGYDKVHKEFKRQQKAED